VNAGGKKDCRAIGHFQWDLVMFAAAQVGFLQRSETLDEPGHNFVEVGRSERAKDGGGVFRQAIDCIATIGGSGRIIRVSVNDAGLLELVKSLAANRFAAVGLVILVIPVPHEVHDVDRAEKRALGGFPLRLWAEFGQSQQRQGRPFVLLGFGQSKRSEDFCGFFDCRHEY
jgi:hypothetical protein